MSNLHIETLELMLTRTDENQVRVSIQGIATSLDNSVLILDKGDTITVNIPNVIVTDTYQSLDFKCWVKK